MFYTYIKFTQVLKSLNPVTFTGYAKKKTVFILFYNLIFTLNLFTKYLRNSVPFLNMYLFLCTCTYILFQADVFSFGIMLCQLIARLPCDPDKLPRSNDFGLSVDQYQGILKSIPPSIQSAPPPQFLQLAFDCCNVIISCSFYKDIYH